MVVQHVGHVLGVQMVVVAVAAWGSVRTQGEPVWSTTS